MKYQVIRIAYGLLLLVFVAIGGYLSFRRFGGELLGQIDPRPPLKDVTWYRDYGWYGYRTNRWNYPVPAFSAVSTSGQNFTQSTPAGNFYVFLIDEDLPSACLNQDCGPGSEVVTNRGGQLMGFSDPKIASLFGVSQLEEVEASKGGFLGEFQWSFGSPNKTLDARLMVVADSKGLLRATYKNATLQDLSEALIRSGVLQ